MCNVLDFLRGKSREIVCSIMRVKLYSITDAFDAVTIILANFPHAFGKKIPIQTSNNSKLVFDMITPENDSLKMVCYQHYSNTQSKSPI